MITTTTISSVCQPDRGIRLKDYKGDKWLKFTYAEFSVATATELEKECSQPIL